MGTYNLPSICAWQLIGNIEYNLQKFMQISHSRDIIPYSEIPVKTGCLINETFW